MCGITGYIGDKVRENLLEGLKNLEFSTFKGLGPDKPRNLAKSVTIE